jgi:flagellar biosynthetic protein FliQ
MDFDTNVEFLRVALWQVIMTAGPLLFVALIVGLIIGIIQAATSINEMTLSFVPKLVIVLMTFGLFSGFMLTHLTTYFQHIFYQISAIGYAGQSCFR